MENELVLNTKSIIVRKGSVTFNEYDSLKLQAESLANQIRTVSVTETNIKQSKKLLAAVNKRLKELEDKRIEVKKTMLEPYLSFENQVREIVSIVKNADETVRDQVKYLEEKEREHKQEAIEEIFYKRKKHYILGDLIKFEDFLTNKHLNKTTSLDSIEKELVSFLEKTKTDYEVIQTLPDAKEILTAYIGVYDLAAAIDTTNQKKIKEAAIEAANKIKTWPADRKREFLFTVYDEKDFKLIEMFLTTNNIKFEAEEILY